jgi:hypothetical protein
LTKSWTDLALLCADPEQFQFKRQTDFWRLPQLEPPPEGLPRDCATAGAAGLNSNKKLKRFI